MSWDTPLPIFDDEDEEALISRFVELMAAHHPAYSEFAIAEQVFEGLRDPGLRSFQAANQWFKQLSIKERIRAAKNNGNKEFKSLSKPDWQAKVMAVIEDDNMGYQEKKVRIDGLNVYATSEGWIKKSIDKETLDKTPQIPSIRWSPLDAS